MGTFNTRVWCWLSSLNVTFCSASSSPGSYEDLITNLILPSFSSLPRELASDSNQMFFLCSKWSPSHECTGNRLNSYCPTKRAHCTSIRAGVTSVEPTTVDRKLAEFLIIHESISLSRERGRSRRTALQVVYLVATPEGDRATGEITTWFREKSVFTFSLRKPGLESFGHKDEDAVLRTGTKSFPSKSETSEFSQSWGFFLEFRLFFCFFFSANLLLDLEGKVFLLSTATNETTLPITRTTY